MTLFGVPHWYLAFCWGENSGREKSLGTRREPPCSLNFVVFEDPWASLSTSYGGRVSNTGGFGLCPTCLMWPSIVEKNPTVDALRRWWKTAVNFVASHRQRRV